MPSLEKVQSNKVANGTLTKYSFPSTALGGLSTNINVFLPSSASSSSKVPFLTYLAGLTCTEDTGAQKGGFFNTAAEHGIALVFPDTSPRGAGAPGEEDDWDFGTGAGFYVDATANGWEKYQMYTFVTEELQEVLKEADLGLDFGRQSIFGHSMGGHGALMIYLRNLERYKSASAFAPICNPSAVPWGKKAFNGYIQPCTRSLPPVEWLAYDSSRLLSRLGSDKGKINILADIGTDDKFLKDGQLEPETLKEAAREAGREAEVEVRMQEDYDHSYFFISTFAPEHIAWHAKHLKA